MAITHKTNPAKRVYLERFWRGTKLKSHARKKRFPKMNITIITDIYLYLAYLMFGFIDLFLILGETPLPKKIEGKI